MNDRRQWLSAIGAAALLAGASSARADDAMAEHAPHHHEGASPFGALAHAAAHCVHTGQACLAHCLVLLGEGDKSMADCSKAVNQMLATCGALQSLAAQGSTLVPALARVALDACTQCQKACEPHVEKHAECKACRDACMECAKQCKDVAA